MGSGSSDNWCYLAADQRRASNMSKRTFTGYKNAIAEDY